jgi:hypothetical protein
MAIKGMVDRLNSEKSDEYDYTNGKNVLDRSALTQFVHYSGTIMRDLPHRIIVGSLMFLFSILGWI